jgi:uncharacterized protein
MRINAVAASQDDTLPLVTTEWILTEFGDAYSDPKDRPDFVALCRGLTKNPRVKIVPAGTQLFQRGVDLFEKRPDKNWSLTDCISFVVMQDEGIRDALTGDHDFEQAGFVALLK